jgi:hypothetical protein
MLPAEENVGNTARCALTHCQPAVKLLGKLMDIPTLSRSQIDATRKTVYTNGDVIKTTVWTPLGASTLG